MKYSEYYDITWEGCGGYVVEKEDNLFVAYYMGEEIGSASELSLAIMLVELEAGDDTA
jgi:hypothetical protein